jgi:hypothetical protein
VKQKQVLRNKKFLRSSPFTGLFVLQNRFAKNKTSKSNKPEIKFQIKATENYNNSRKLHM